MHICVCKALTEHGVPPGWPKMTRQLLFHFDLWCVSFHPHTHTQTDLYADSLTPIYTNTNTCIHVQSYATHTNTRQHWSRKTLATASAMATCHCNWGHAQWRSANGKQPFNLLKLLIYQTPSVSVATSFCRQFAILFSCLSTFSSSFKTIIPQVIKQRKQSGLFSLTQVW